MKASDNPFAGYIDFVLDITRASEAYRRSYVATDRYSNIQIRDGETWRGIDDAARLGKTKQWWRTIFRLRYEFFDYAMKTRRLTRIYPLVIVDVPKKKEPGLFPTPSETETMLDQLDIKAIALARNMATFQINSFAVFSDEDATLLSAHFSTEQDLKTT